MDKKQLKINIERKLNSEYIAQEEYFRELAEYFIEKIDKNEKGILLVAGERNTFKKASIRTTFEVLKEEKLIDNEKLDEIDLSSYNFNMGYNAFLTDLYDVLNNSSSYGVIFKNTEKASNEILSLLSKIYPNSCLKLKNRYKVKNKFLIDADQEENNTINEIICHNKFFIFIYNYEVKMELDNFIESSLKNADKLLYTRALTEKEKNNIIRKKLNNEIYNIKEEYGVQILLGYKENISEKENQGVFEYLQDSFSKKGSFAITEYIKYRFSNPAINLIKKENLSQGEKILVYVEGNVLKCKVNNSVYNLNRYSIPILEEVKYKLESIIGLKELKEFLLNIENNNKVQKIREKLGLRTSYISLNMIFAGNAGTGKTNAARITYEYLNALGEIREHFCMLKIRSR